jgi:cytochrome c oxidase subunit 1
MGVAAFFGMFAGIYHWFPKMFGRYMNNTLAFIHFWITFIGSYLIFWPMHYMGLAGVPRRYLDLNSWLSFNQFGELNKMITVVAMLVFAVNLLFVFNFFYSIFKGRKLTTNNPWGSNTLEWTTDIVPGHGNWHGEIPEVHRWPYDYGKNGREFIPQTEPTDENETQPVRPFILRR